MQITINERRTDEDITVQVGYTEDGEFVVEECNHAGAEYQPTVGYTWWDDAHTMVPDGDGPEVLVCDKCNMWNNDGIWEQS